MAFFEVAEQELPVDDPGDAVIEAGGMVWRDLEPRLAHVRRMAKRRTGKQGGRRQKGGGTGIKELSDDDPMNSPRHNQTDGDRQARR